MKSLNKITKLSELLEVAVNDYKKISKDNRYFFKPNLWHTQYIPWHTQDIYESIHESSNNRCNVCLAGCVIAKTLDIPSNKETDPKEFDFRTENYLYAIDSFLNCNFYTMIENFYIGKYNLEARGELWEEKFIKEFGRERLSSLSRLCNQDHFDEDKCWDEHYPKVNLMLKQIKRIKEVYKL